MSARRAKLVCTLGPASGTEGGVRALAEAGTDVFRVNLSHGDPATHAELVRLVRAAASELGRDLAVMADLPGPKIRLGELAEEPLRLDAGTAFALRADERPGDASGAPTTYPGLARDVRPGDRVLLADGAVELVVRDIEGSDVVTEVIRAGSVRARAGVNVPAERLSLPALTERDREGLARALDLGVDLIAQSFVRAPADPIGLRALMGDRPVPIVAKIETRPAVEAIDAVLLEADALMVARGDLGVELPMEEIPILQKELLRKARAAGKPAIVATQMLESMIHAPRPTRAEASDVANAVLDGADAIMLSGETAIGDFPVEAARAAARIAEVAEERAGRFRTPREPCRHTDEAAAVAHAAAQVAAGDPEVVAIACYTGTGRTAALLSAERPGVPIFAFSSHPEVRRALGVRWGVTALAASSPVDTDEMIAAMDAGLRAAEMVTAGQAVVMAASSPAGKAHTNMLKVHHIGSAVR
ncbi:MAG: pyruvate kinase [Candidatus Velamenicoccus archaeovorus]